MTAREAADLRDDRIRDFRAMVPTEFNQLVEFFALGFGAGEPRLRKHDGHLPSLTVAVLDG